MSVTKASGKRDIWSKCGHKLEMSGRTLSADQFKRVRESFGQLDKNGDGRISVSELMRAQQSLGLNPSRRECQKMIREIDCDESGFIELNEYMEVMAERVGALQYERQQMKAAFQHFDKDCSGKLSRGELRHLLTSNLGEPLTEEEFNDVIRDMDLDGDGAIDVEELCAMLCQVTPST